MATDSASLPRLLSDDSENPGPVHQKNNEPDVMNTIDPKLSSTPSPFVYSQPMREEQVENAVKFLAHPKVRGSPVVYRRSFLEKKGLTREEIDEAFRRVPDPPPSSSDPADQSKPSTNLSLQGAGSNLQSATPAPAAVVPAGSAIMKPRFQWSHFFLSLGVVATCGAGTTVLIKNYVIPWLKTWIRRAAESESDSVRKENKEPNVVEEAMAAAKEAAAAAAYVAKTNLEMLNSKNADYKSLEDRMNQLDSQLKEIKAITLKLSGTTRSPSPSYVEPSVAPQPKSFIDVMAMVQRGETPSNIKDINDTPPNPTQPLPNPRLPPKPKPWELGEVQNGGGAHAEYSPWKQQRSVKITELEADGEWAGGLPVQRSWVPPQPPPISMPEAASAIRMPKAVSRREGVLNDVEMVQSVSEELRSDDGASELGGLDIGGGGNGWTSKEIFEET